ncbi:nucleolar and spindle-associated protein 1 [Parambassis ranga]|uniref:Nucleolar and spindle-associated protein 1 n=1 Tax=Parambassis ranga TaxID=210632 RepID=A0A6P7HLY2_9TELE|nr:nucleolar and spindle-associated protein 1 [Parambassis ranga]
MDLDSMKYAELRSLAKELGIRANGKADKLLKALKQYYQQENIPGEEERGHGADAKEEDENVTQDCDDTSQEEKEKEEVCSTVFVNTRRGRRSGAKRKSPDAAVETGMQMDAAEGDTEMDAVDAKKRKLSSAKDCDETELEPQTTGTEQQPDIKPEASTQEKAPKVAKAGKIPRYQGAQQKTKLKPVTPNFKKLHEAHFNKMESIDSYFQRKTKQVESLKNSEVKKANAARASMFSPAPANKRPAEDTCRKSLPSNNKALPNKSAVKKDVLFKPMILSTRRINVRFSEATRDNEHKRSLVKTPARMSPCVASSTPQKQAAEKEKPSAAKASVFSATKTPVPFVFTGNTNTPTTPGTQKKTVFNLKESLSRPLTYKPHKGKLKPFGETKENTVANKSLVSSTHQENYKQHKVHTRDERRTKQIETRKQKKENMLGARRGLVMM